MKRLETIRRPLSEVENIQNEIEFIKEKICKLNRVKAIISKRIEDYERDLKKLKRELNELKGGTKE